MRMLMIMLVCLIPCALWAQASDDLPQLYYAIFNEQMISAVLVIVGAVKLLRNLFGDKAKGWVAVIITAAGALIYGVVQFGFSEHGIWYGIIAGLLAAGTFYFSKKTNKAFAIDSGIIIRLFLGLGKILKHFLMRK